MSLHTCGESWGPTLKRLRRILRELLVVLQASLRSMERMFSKSDNVNFNISKYYIERIKYYLISETMVSLGIQQINNTGWVQSFKPLAKRTRKSTRVLDLRPTCVSFGHPLAWTCIHLRGLALTLVELKFGRK